MTAPTPESIAAKFLADMKPRRMLQPTKDKLREMIASRDAVIEGFRSANKTIIEQARLAMKDFDRSKRLYVIYKYAALAGWTAFSVLAGWVLV